jgi:hypothetical protein
VVFSSEERVLAFCALILWPRTKAVIPAHVITAALRTLWNRFMSYSDALARVRRGGGGEGGEAGGAVGDGEWEYVVGGYQVVVMMGLFVVRDLLSLGGYVRMATCLPTSITGEALNKLADVITEATDRKHLARALLLGDNRGGWMGGEGGGGGRGRRINQLAVLVSVHSLLISNF